MKKLLALILAAAMSLSLAACGNGSTSSGGGSTSEPAGTPAASSGEETGWVPTEDIEFVIPFGAGGGNDVMVRKILRSLKIRYVSGEYRPGEQRRWFRSGRLYLSHLQGRRV